MHYVASEQTTTTSSSPPASAPSLPTPKESSAQKPIGTLLADGLFFQRRMGSDRQRHYDDLGEPLLQKTHPF